MKISHIKIANILGIEHLEFSPEGFTQIAGPNGQGKTSVLEAIKSAIGQGHDATLLRKGAEKGEVVLVLEDGTQIQQRVTQSGTTRNVVKDGKKLTSPGAAIKALTDVLSVNPVEFLTARKQDRVKVLLESMPIEIDVEKLSAISGIPVRVQPGVHPLTVVDFVRKQVYDDRTGTNRAVTEKDGTINQLEIAIAGPSGEVGLDHSDEDELRAKLQAVKDAWDAESKRIDTKLGTLREESAARAQVLKDEAQVKIDAIRAQLNTDLEAERAALAQTEQRAAAQREKKHGEMLAASQPLNEAIRAIVADRDAAARRKATLATIAQMRQEREELAADADRQTAALEAIDAYKLELLASLPIPGLEVVDGEIVRDGVPFDRLNTAQRVGIAYEIAKLRAGDLRVICLDGMELLDDSHLAELQRRAEADGLQVFITRVHGDEFAVTTH